MLRTCCFRCAFVPNRLSQLVQEIGFVWDLKCFFRALWSLNVLSHWVQDAGFTSEWIFWWRFKTCFCLNPWLQMSQIYFRSEWISLCLVRSPLLWKLFKHTSHECGLCCVCLCPCWTKRDSLIKDLEQMTQENCLNPVWITLCILRLWRVLKDFWQYVQVNCFWAWEPFIWRFSKISDTKDFGHKVHKYFFMSWSAGASLCISWWRFSPLFEEHNFSQTGQETLLLAWYARCWSRFLLTLKIFWQREHGNDPSMWIFLCLSSVSLRQNVSEQSSRTMCSFMPFQWTFWCKCFLANCTNKWFFTCMSSPVIFKLRYCIKILATIHAWFLNSSHFPRINYSNQPDRILQRVIIFLFLLFSAVR